MQTCGGGRDVLRGPAQESSIFYLAPDYRKCRICFETGVLRIHRRHRTTSPVRASHGPCARPEAPTTVCFSRLNFATLLLPGDAFSHPWSPVSAFDKYETYASIGRRTLMVPTGIFERGYEIPRPGAGLHSAVLRGAEVSKPVQVLRLHGFPVLKDQISGRVSG